jgi:hypothetical protein
MTPYDALAAELGADLAVRLLRRLDAHGYEIVRRDKQRQPSAGPSASEAFAPVQQVAMGAHLGALWAAVEPAEPEGTP